MDTFKNILTLGAHGRVQKKMEEYRNLRSKYQAKYNLMEMRRSRVNRTLQKVIDLKVSASKSLEKWRYLSKDFQMTEKSINLNQVSHKFDYIDQTLNAYNIAVNAAAGITSGVGTAVGAWALVSALGSASTGTAIASLSGIAATNATLAWFGGGALAVGGGGMAAGSVVLGGLVLLPALAVLGVFSHMSANKKIKEIENEMEEMLSNMIKIKANLKILLQTERKAQKLIRKLENNTKAFDLELERTQKKLQGKIGVLTKVVYFLRCCFTGFIDELGKDLAKLINTPVLDYPAR
ncbi:hypothetical protein [Paenibacillus sp. KN14-4R]|uniref:hypothetical protein n=1 Tax=Paenibacillus sp. KN14-4R TaxID=3445773 RepID=UPI003F9EECF4